MLCPFDMHLPNTKKLTGSVTSRLLQNSWFNGSNAICMFHNIDHVALHCHSRVNMSVADVLVPIWCQCILNSQPSIWLRSVSGALKWCEVDAIYKMMKKIKSLTSRVGEPDLIFNYSYSYNTSVLWGNRFKQCRKRTIHVCLYFFVKSKLKSSDSAREPKSSRGPVGRGANLQANVSATVHLLRSPTGQWRQRLIDADWRGASWSRGTMVSAGADSSGNPPGMSSGVKFPWLL